LIKFLPVCKPGNVSLDLVLLLAYLFHVEQREKLSSLLNICSDEIGISLEPDHIRQFMIYLEQLRIWNRSMNLTSVMLDEEVIIKHFVDSLAGLRAIDIWTGARLLDVGTGAGFPGIPLRLVRPDLSVTMIEPVQKKVSFLRSIVGLLRLESVTIFSGTLERFAIENPSDQTFDFITTRALKYDFLLRNTARLLAPEGKEILYLSHPINRLELGTQWSVVNEYMFDLPRGYGRRVVSVLCLSEQKTN
jgi:16S rRNA (guanine527-N7)-methyltransferase